jgi:hypothetical protein
MRLFKSKEEKQEIDAARADFDQFVLEAGRSEPGDVKSLALAFKENLTSVRFRSGSARSAGRKHFVPSLKTR